MIRFAGERDVHVTRCRRREARGCVRCAGGRDRADRIRRAGVAVPHRRRQRRARHARCRRRAGSSARGSAGPAVGGRGDPPGYPLYVLWLRAWSWLPGSTPAHTAALATVILGAAALLVLHAACRAWGARPLAASIAVAVYAAAPIIVRYHSEAEVFALNHLIAALVLWLAAARGPLRGAWRGAALGLVAGLGLANHLTCALLAPVGILGLVRALRESRPRLAAAALALVGLAVGLVP